VRVGQTLRYGILMVHHVGEMLVGVRMGVVIGGWATWRRERGMSVHGQVRVWTGRRRYYCHGAVVPFGQARLCLVTRAAATLIHRRLRV